MSSPRPAEPHAAAPMDEAGRLAAQVNELGAELALIAELPLAEALERLTVVQTQLASALAGLDRI